MPVVATMVYNPRLVDLTCAISIVNEKVCAVFANGKFAIINSGRITQSVAEGIVHLSEDKEFICIKPANTLITIYNGLEVLQTFLSFKT
jgi:hypothetical protein